MNLNKHFTILLACCIALLGIGVSCKDKNNNNSSSPCEENPGQCQTVLEAKDYFLFNNGSWWVYEEETSHERDSMYVTESYNDSNGYGFDVRIKSSLTDYEYHYWPEYYGVNNGCSVTSQILKRCLYVRRAKYKFQDHLGESFVFFLHFNVGEYVNTGSDMVYCPNNKIIIAAIHDSLVLPNFTFYKTIQVNEICSFQEGKQPTKFYYTKSIGIVRKEFIDSNEVWNLVNYHIEP